MPETATPTSQPAAQPGTQPATPATPQGGPQQPAWINGVPEKFRRGTIEETLSAVLGSNGELEKKLGERGQQKPDPATPAQPAEPKQALSLISTPDTSTRGVQRVLQAAGLDGKEQELKDHWEKNGNLSEEHYRAFEKAGRDREEVDDFFEGQAARSREARSAKENAIRDGDKAAGGADQHKALLVWANKNMLDELKEYEAMVKLRPSFYPKAIKAILVAYNEAVGAGKAQPLVSGETPANGNVSDKELSDLRRRYRQGDEAAADRLAQIGLSKRK